MNKALFEEDWSDLFKLYFSKSISRSFIATANIQLFKNIEELLQINLNEFPKVKIAFSPNKPLQYKSGPISSLSASMILNYGVLPIEINWSSFSGKIYMIDEEINDPDDLKFWLENLEPGLVKQYLIPVFSLIPFKPHFIELSALNERILFSNRFVEIMDRQLSEQFTQKTDIKFNKNIGLVPVVEVAYKTALKPWKSPFDAFLMIGHHSHLVQISWTSLKGRSYYTDETQIEEDDIRFHLPPLDVPKIYSQLYPESPSPLNIKNLPFQLTIDKLDIHSTWELTTKKPENQSAQEIIRKIDEFLKESTESKFGKNKYGTIHNWTSYHTGNRIIYEIDLGSPGVSFIKKTLKFIGQLNCVNHIHIS